jgi:hypothetical protein
MEPATPKELKEFNERPKHVKRVPHPEDFVLPLEHLFLIAGVSECFKTKEVVEKIQSLLLFARLAILAIERIKETHPSQEYTAEMRKVDLLIRISGLSDILTNLRRIGVVVKKMYIQCHVPVACDDDESPEFVVHTFK